MGGGALRLVLFVDPNLASSVALLDASLKVVAARQDVEVAAIVDTASRPPSPLRGPRAVTGWALRRACNLTTAAEPEDTPLLRTCASLARRRHIEVLAPRQAGVNDPGFVQALQRLEPNATIALMVAQIFRSSLLAACNLPLNYHNGLLPNYRGVAATGWSIYERAPQSGFSFHEMSEEVDGGPILLQGAVQLSAHASAAPVERAKTRLAGAELGRLFDLLSSGERQFIEQRSPGSSFNRAALKAIRAVEAPGNLPLEELELRLRAFETLELTLDGRAWSVTALRRVGARARNPRLAFTTADGISVEPSRLMHLPPAVYRPLASALTRARA